MPTNPTDAQRESSRRNGAASRGPKTEAGKARSALNGLKHGHRAATVVLTNESAEIYHQLRQSYLTRFHPTDQFEQDLVIQMVNAAWRLRRVQAQESALLDLEMFVQREDLAEVFAKVDSVTAQALAFKAIAVHDPAVAVKLDRHENRYFRQLERAHRMFLLARRNRTFEPDAPVPAAPESISPNESTISEDTNPPAVPSQSETKAEEARDPHAGFIPDSNTVEEDDYQRYEYQPDWRPDGAPSSSRFAEILNPNLRKPDPDPASRQ